MNALIGFTRSDWWKVLRAVDFSVDRRYLRRFIHVTLLSLMNTGAAKKEEKQYSVELDNIEIQSPIFILGHWRSGTTLLHELFTLDEQYAFPNLFEVSNPHTFISREPIIEKQAANIPPSKRPMDNMEVSYRHPGEDEPALAVMSLRSPAIAWMFPRYEEYYDRFLTFDGVGDQDIQPWKQSVLSFMNKLTLRYNKPLVMKSPAHTARIKLILDIFPDARFIHIHRNPYVVYQSTVKLYNTAVAGAYLHDPMDGTVKAGILNRYEMMYKSFFDQRKLIPNGQYVEVGFESFEKDIVNQMQNIYQELSLEGFDRVAPKFLNYVEQHRNYQKNEHPPISEPLKSEIANRWNQCFAEWEYVS